ncbi:MAG: TetR/AcrR family transcriptional regulator [Chloroflexi bacterium]|nr:TetR/AcrR family transcriptional regulator [Chloroflexota bacterium]MBP8059994.1 TetR/AcrR family transcriptional regulator [Chloroflexota bacterium]
MTKTTPHTLSPRRQRNREAMVTTILDTARVIMREQGVAALSMQELARRLDMRAPSLYNYFSSKVDIYDTLFRHGFQLYAEHQQKMTEGAQTWQEELRLSFEAYMTFALQNPELYQLCFERPVPGFIPSEESLQVSFGLLNSGYDRITRLLEVIDTPLAPNQVRDLLIAMMHGLTALHMANEPHLPLGQGRFGALIPAALSILEKAWSKSSP